MPSTTPERAARWPGMDSEAISYLTSRGHVLERDWTWTLMPKGMTWEMLTERERDAIWYLIEEWDFGGVNG